MSTVLSKSFSPTLEGLGPQDKNYTVENVRSFAYILTDTKKCSYVMNDLRDYVRNLCSYESKGFETVTSASSSAALSQTES